MRYVFKVKRDGSLSSNNPDDIALLQELSRRDAELHIAYAAHLYASKSELLKAARQWELGLGLGLGLGLTVFLTLFLFLALTLT